MIIKITTYVNAKESDLMVFLKKEFLSFSLPPLLGLLCAFMAGIMVKIPFIISCLLVSITTAIHLYNTRKDKHNRYTKFLLAGAFIHLLSGYWYDYQTITYHDFYSTIGAEPCTISGYITDIIAQNDNRLTPTVIKLKTRCIHAHGKELLCGKNVHFYCSQKISDLQVGDQITVFDVQCKKPNNEPFIAYQIKENIAATLFCKNFNYKLLNRPTFSFSRWIHTKKNYVLHTLRTKMSPHCFSFFTSFFLGNRAITKNSTESCDDQFKQWGIYHLLARSGIHLTLFIFMWTSIGNYIPLPFTVKQLFFLILGILYYIFSWPSLPFIRAFMQFSINKSCQLLRFSYHPLHYLSLVCFLVALYTPQVIFFLDFQLTFLLTYALTWLNQLEQERFAQKQAH